MFFGDMSSGGSDDLQKVYSLTRTMVTQYGMGKDTYNLTLDESSYIQK
jgi:ATP-dependent Zn protease